MSVEDQPNTVLDVYTTFAWVQETGSGTSNFTKAQADQLYLRKTVEDTDPNIANFTAGIKTNSITSVAGDISLGQTTTTTQDITDNTTKIATTAWVKLQGYITSAALTGYATEAWVLGKNYITSSALTGYATEAWVLGKNYITVSALTGYATEAWVLGRNYITVSALTGYATEAWVLGRNYITVSALTGYATEAWVLGRNYITVSALTGYATQAWVTSQGYLTNSIFSSANSWSGTNNFSVSGSLTCANPPSGSTGVQVVNADWVIAKGYLTAASFAGYAQLALANTWNLLQTFTSGIATNSITSISGNISLGTATTTTQIPATDNTTIATTAYVKSQNYGSKDAYNTWNNQQSLQGGLSVSTITNYLPGVVSLSATTGATTLAPGAGDNTTRIPTTAWVTTHVTSALVGYATQAWVTSQNYITASALVGYATETYVTTRGYITTYAGIFTSNNSWSGTNSFGGIGNLTCDTPLSGSTTTQVVNAEWVIAKAYITASALVGYATEAWVTSQNYITASALVGYATETYVTTRGYITTYAGIFTSNNSWSGTNNFSVSGNLTCANPAAGSTGTQVVNAAWVLAKGYATAAAQLDIFQTWTALQYFSVGLRTGSISPPVGAGEYIDIGEARTITQVVGTSNTSLATTAFVYAQGFAAGVNTTTAYTWSMLQTFASGICTGNIYPPLATQDLDVCLNQTTGNITIGDNSLRSGGINIGTQSLPLTANTVKIGCANIAVSLQNATAPTQVVGTNNTTLATTAFVLANANFTITTSTYTRTFPAPSSLTTCLPRPNGSPLTIGGTYLVNVYLAAETNITFTKLTVYLATSTNFIPNGTSTGITDLYNPVCRLVRNENMSSAPWSENLFGVITVTNADARYISVSTEFTSPSVTNIAGILRMTRIA